MRFKALKDLSRAAPLEVMLGSLPEEIYITDYAKAKAFAVSELVRRVHGEAFEWYGFTLAERTRPEVIVDVGLPENTENLETYTSISSERKVGRSTWRTQLSSGETARWTSVKGPSFRYTSLFAPDSKSRYQIT